MPGRGWRGNGGATKGRKATTRQLEGLRAGWLKQKVSPHMQTPETRIKMSAAKVGWKPSARMIEATKKAIQNETAEHRAARCAKSGRSRRGKSTHWTAGDKHWNWRGGINQKHETERKLFQRKAEYVAWRRGVFERDNFTCQHCGVKGVYLHADHIKPYSTHPKLRIDLSNGRTLCVSCHRKTDTWGMNTRHMKSGG